VLALTRVHQDHADNSENTNVNTTNANAKCPTCLNSTLPLEELCKLSFEQLYKMDLKHKAPSIPQAGEILDKGGYLTRDAPITTLIIATILMLFLAFHNGRLLGKEAQAVLQAIATILADKDTLTTANLVASKVLDMAEVMIEEIQKAAKGLDAAMSMMLQTTEEADTTTERMARQAEHHFGDQGRMMETAKTAEATLSTLQEHTGQLEDLLVTISTQATISPLHLGAEPWPPLPSLHMPTPPPEVVVQHAAAEHNVVFDLTTPSAEDARDLTMDKLVQCANLAINKMGSTAAEKPNEMIFVAATKLARRGIQYRMMYCLDQDPTSEGVIPQTVL
jgi:hypothetical protein